MLSQITPVILTYNEESNIRRTLERLAWAKRIVVVDSLSVDGTADIVRSFTNTDLYRRPFDSHQRQWEFAVRDTNIHSEWILRLDADYIVSDDLVEEIGGTDPGGLSGFRIAFDYGIYGRPLSASLYPPNTILFRRGRETIIQDGHTERWQIAGETGELNGRILHDDWKPMSEWVASQVRYMERERESLKACAQGYKRRLRLRAPLMPFLTFFYVLFWKGLILNGRAGIFYATQRLAAETILSLLVLEDQLRSNVSAEAKGGRVDPAAGP